MDDLLTILKQIDALEMKNSYARLLNNSKNKDVKDLAEKASALADTILIGPNGNCLWDQHDVLKAAGYDIFPGERDSIGWLTGCIQTTKGVIMYG
jgi:hypothetical protein